MKCSSLQVPVKETTRTSFPGIMPSPKGLLSFFFPSFFPLLVKKSKDVHIKSQSGPITGVGNGKVGEVQVLATFL